MQRIIKSIFAFTTFFSFNKTCSKLITQKWPQMKDYHQVMVETLRPAEKGNLDPIKKQAATLLQNAEALTIENMPPEFRSPKLIETLLVLRKKTQKVDNLVQQKATDKEIITALTCLNNTYNQIIGLCQPKKH